MRVPPDILRLTPKVSRETDDETARVEHGNPGWAGLDGTPSLKSASHPSPGIRATSSRSQVMFNECSSAIELYVAVRVMATPHRPSLAAFVLPPQLDPNPEQEGCDEADANGDQDLWLPAKPRSCKQAAEDRCTNGDSDGTHVGAHDKEDDCP
jgi:hypothetical protein